jgi:hypothetical protein
MSSASSRDETASNSANDSTLSPSFIAGISLPLNDNSSNDNAATLQPLTDPHNVRASKHVKDEDNFPSQFQENISTIVDPSILSNNNDQDKPKLTTTTIVARHKTNGSKRKKLFSSTNDNTTSQLSITTFLCSKKIQSTSKQIETNITTTSSGINNHTGTSSIIVGPNKKTEANKKQQVSITPCDSNIPDTRYNLACSHHDKQPELSATTLPPESTNRLVRSKVLTLADFPTRKPLLDITNRLMLRDDEIILPNWILHDKRFHHQPSFEKKKNFSNKKDKGNHTLCRKNVMETLHDYVDKKYGPMDSFSGCSTLLCKVKDRKTIGAGFTWSPQRWDLEIGHEQELDNFSTFSNYFVNKWPKDKAYFIASWIAHSYNSEIAVPSTFTHTIQVPTFPYDVVRDEEDEDFQHFLVYATTKLSKENGGSGNRFHIREQQCSNPRPVTVTMEYMKELYWENGGSYCRIFGVKGSWVPNSDNLLSIDKIDVKKGYEPGNLMIMLACANFGRNEFHWHDFLFWRDSFVRYHLTLETPATYVGTVVEYICYNTGFLLVCKYPGCIKQRVNDGYCMEHGAIVPRCNFPGCSNQRKKGGFCVKHGAVKLRCNFPGCSNNPKKGGFCIKHGGETPRCKYPGCSNYPKKGGFCIKHGAETPRCKYPGCSNQRQKGGFCKKHGKIKL